MATTAERVKDIIVKQLGVKPEEVVDSASFTDDLGADRGGRGQTDSVPAYCAERAVVLFN